jgi:hypothetical protein
MNEEIRALDAKGDALRARHAAVIEELKAHRAVRDAAVQRQLDALTDEQIKNDEATKRWLLKESWGHSGAHQREQIVAAVGASGASPDGYDSREEYEADILPGLQLALHHGQPVEELAGAIRSWAAEWALGRPDIPVAVLEANCAANGSYGGRYHVADDRLEIGIARYHRLVPVKDGPLVEVLGYVSENLAFDGPTDTDDYDYED